MPLQWNRRLASVAFYESFEVRDVVPETNVVILFSEMLPVSQISEFLSSPSQFTWCHKGKNIPTSLPLPIPDEEKKIVKSLFSHFFVVP